MEQVILEVIKDGHRLEPKVFSGLVIHIGRGYDNDLIVADPYVSEHHCLIRSNEDGFIVEDLTSLNGTWVCTGSQDHKNVGKTQADKKPFPPKEKAEIKIKIQSSQRIYSGDSIIIGHTKLRFFVSRHLVEPTRRMVNPSVFFEEISKPFIAWPLVITALCLSSFIEHQESYKNLPLSKFVSVSIGLLLTILIWTGIWSFVGWLVKRRAFFSAHLSWATLFFLSMTITYPLADYLGYITSSQMVELIVGSTIFWLFISCLIAGHLMIATFIRRQYQITVAVILSMTVVLFGVFTYYSGKEEFSPQPDLYSTLVPPYGKLMRPADSVEQFLNTSDHIFLNKTHDK